MALVPLPIDPILPDVVARLAKATALVLQASPGSGKTTRVPPALLAAPFTGDRGKILVLEPRRLAAKYAARRVADERGESVGETVGYHFRFENVSGPRTRILFLTEGMLMRRLLGDPKLAGVSAVVLDEFHERHLHSDTALAYLRSLQGTTRPDLRIVVMSATLDSEAIASYLGGCDIVRTEARNHPIEISYLPDRAVDGKPLELLVRDAVASVLKGTPDGDCLVFLPGMGEIRRAESALEPLARAHGWRVLPLHGELSREEQDMAIRPSDRPKAVLATNVAETSLTIEGVTSVVDSGLHRLASYSWWSGIPALKTRAISRASAVQRAGRAGRTAPGRCLRLYTRGDFDSRPPFETPEIRRADMAQTFLELKAMGIAEPAAMPWLEAPEPQAMDAARELLWRLGALASRDGSGALTALGKRMAELPAHPRIARLLLEAEKAGIAGPAATLAALLSEGALESLDALDRLDERSLDGGARRVRRSLASALGGAGSERLRPDWRDRLAFSVLVGFPDRVARKRDAHPQTARLKQGETELVFSSGGSAKIENAGIVAEHQTFVALELQERKAIHQARSQLWVRSLVPIRDEWLFDVEPGGVEEREELSWDKDRKRVVATSRMAYGQLTLAESHAEPQPTEASARLLMKEGLGIDPARAGTFSLHEWITALAPLADREALEATLARVKLVAAHFPELGLPNLDETGLAPQVLRLFAHHHEMKALLAMDWPSELLEALAKDARRKIEELTPGQLTLPSGRRARIQYSLDKAPWVESRLQDFFGMRRGPAVLGGRVPLTLHLLAPNQRAVQVTQDLAGFWERAYPSIRKELSRKYPRHAWPEDTSKPVPQPPPRRR